MWPSQSVAFMPLPDHTCTKRTPRSTSRRASRQRPPKSALTRIVEAVELLRRFRFAADIGRFRRRHLHPERELVGCDARGQLGILIPRRQMLLVHLAQRVEQIALLLGLHARRTAEIQNRIAAGAERGPLIGRRQEALAVHRRSRPHTAFQQHDEAGQILILAAETVENPRSQARPADPRPAVVDQELRLRMREALVIAGADDGEIVDALRSVRKQIRDFESRLAVLLEGPFRAENERVLELAVLEIFIAEAGRRMLAVQLCRAAASDRRCRPGSARPA